MSNNYVSGGIGFGSVIAMILSFDINHSIGWMILHGFISWIYVIYVAFFSNYSIG